MAPSSAQMFQLATNTSISHSSFTIQMNENHCTSSDAFDRLQTAAAPNALHNSGARFDPPKCHQNTRVSVLNRLMDWIVGNFEPEAIVMWLYGPAGAGKSAIAQTLAERCVARGLLLGAFIFSRTDPTRNSIRPLPATLAYQIAVLDRKLRSLIEEAVAANPMIFSQTLETQLRTLFVNPLLTLLDHTSNTPPFPSLIIIDGLDECLDSEAQCHFIHVLSDILHEQRLPIKFLIASRPEPRLVIEFNSGDISDLLSRLALDDSWRPDSDIRLFLDETFRKIKERHPLRQSIPPSWPSNDTLADLVRRSSGQFIHAVTVSKFVSSIQHQPMQRLAIILGINPVKATDMPFDQLDALYMHIFEMVTDTEMALNIMGVLVVLEIPRSQFIPSEVIKMTRKIEGIASMLFYDVGDVRLCLCELSSVVDCTEQGDVTILHASLADFFLNSQRSQRFHINRGSFYSYLSRMCIRHIVEDDDKFATGYAYTYFAICYPSSAQTLDLIEAVRGLDFEAIHYSSTSRSSTHLPSWSLLVTVITTVKSAGPNELYAHLLKKMDCLILRVLGDYTSVHDILLLTTLLGITDPRTTGHIPINAPNCPISDQYDISCKAGLFEIERNVRSFDFRKGLRLLSYGTRRNEYSNLLREFFTDPSRSGKYALDGRRYISAVIKILNWTDFQGFISQEGFLYSDAGRSLRQEVNLRISCIPALLQKCPRSDKIISIAHRPDFLTAIRNINRRVTCDNQSPIESLKEYILRVDPENTDFGF